MMRFVSIEKKDPDKREARERSQDFKEIETLFANNSAKEQASRCCQCGVPMCQVHCPLENNIPDWLKALANGQEKEAYRLVAETNTFPEICGRICPQDRLCEGFCVLHRQHGSITIGAIEKYLTEKAWEEKWVQAPHPEDEQTQSVGIIGAGPAGLAAAESLRRKGYQVHIYDRYDRPGGLLTYGIPSFKLEKTVIERRIESYKDAGIQFHCNFEVGKTARLQELRKRHGALLIATGVYKARPLHIPGTDLRGVVEALEYLVKTNRQELDCTPIGGEDDLYNARDKNVVIIGGGDTAMDCARTAIRQKAKSVTVLYRRNRENMPGSQKEVKNADEEGVVFQWLAAPVAYISDSTINTISKVQFIRMQIGLSDANGRRTVNPVEGSEQYLPADLLIHALGYEPEDLPRMFDEPSLKVTSWGTLVIDKETCQTSLDGVFAAGDIVRGASLVVWAIKDGRMAADKMHQHIQKNFN
jgi:glutamate synthase (NADPH/NADH) small chain